MIKRFSVPLIMTLAHITLQRMQINIQYIVELFKFEGINGSILVVEDGENR